MGPYRGSESLHTRSLGTVPATHPGRFGQRQYGSVNTGVSAFQREAPSEAPTRPHDKIDQLFLLCLTRRPVSVDREYEKQADCDVGKVYIQLPG